MAGVTCRHCARDAHVARWREPTALVVRPPARIAFVLLRLLSIASRGYPLGTSARVALDTTRRLGHPSIASCCHDPGTIVRAALDTTGSELPDND